MTNISLGIHSRHSVFFNSSFYRQQTRQYDPETIIAISSNSSPKHDQHKRSECKVFLNIYFLDIKGKDEMHIFQTNTA